MTTPLTTAQIKRAGELIEKLERIEDELQGIFRSDEGETRTPSLPRASSPKRRKMSAAARARIAAAQRERWAKTKNGAKPKGGASKPQPKGKARKKRVMSPEARAKIAAAQKRRWAKQRKAK